MSYLLRLFEAARCGLDGGREATDWTDCIRRTAASAKDGGSRACWLARNDRLRSGEEGRRSRCRPGPVRCQTSPKERPYGGLSRRQQNDVIDRRRLIRMISRRLGHHPSRRPGRHLPGADNMPTFALLALGEFKERECRSPSAGMDLKPPICSTRRTSPAPTIKSRKIA